jgi:hypothetical protein
MSKRISAYKILSELCEEAIFWHQLPNVDEVIKYITTVSDFKHLDKREITKIMDRVMTSYAAEGRQ